MTNYPETVINKYVWKQFEIARPTIYSTYGNIVPIFPITDTKAGDTAWEQKPYIVYDSFMKMRSRNRIFYPIKSAQMIYSIKGSITQIYEWRDFIYNVLDRGDIVANELNDFGGTLPGEISYYFHSVEASQINYINNTTQQAGQRKDFSTDLIIKYDFHRTDIYNA